MSGWTVIGLLAAFSAGWIAAHATVATECDRIGAFYVGKTVYTCIKKETK